MVASQLGAFATTEGITPKWGPVTFNFAGLYYSYPGFNDVLDYFEALGGATWTTGNWSFGIKDYWSPDNFQTPDKGTLVGAPKHLAVGLRLQALVREARLDGGIPQLPPVRHLHSYRCQTPER
jgi:hypothetical protein